MNNTIIDTNCNKLTISQFRSGERKEKQQATPNGNRQNRQDYQFGERSILLIEPLRKIDRIYWAV
jgi:hypothetical protein